MTSPISSGHPLLDPTGFGLSTRARDNLTQPTKALPWLTQLLTSFVRAHFPHHKFSCVAVRVGGKLQVHQDFATEGLSVLCSGSGDAPCGFWISDSSGQDFEEFGEHFIPGVVVDLSEGPLEFDAKAPHCGYINSRPKDQQTTNQNRISIAALHLKRNSVPDNATIEALLNLGFAIPDPLPHPKPRHQRHPNTETTRSTILDLLCRQHKNKTPDPKAWIAPEFILNISDSEPESEARKPKTQTEETITCSEEVGSVTDDADDDDDVLTVPRLISSRRPYRWWPKVMS